ncbi:hypothetical protein WJX84_009057 [Apatococcus fuscideae]|uniref:Cupin-like domain-containing protein n=1 Tax=Apatococcus fuscideae TaxID=2026836 RepID=A0AAW1SM70_9CHLO
MDCLKKLSREIRELDLGTQVDVCDGVPDRLSFLRDYVACNKPLLIRGAVQHWPAVKDDKWSWEGLQGKLDGKQVTVAVMPNGRADADY